MISNQVLQSTIDGIQTIAKVELGVMDSEGREQAVTAPVFSEAASFVPKFAQSPADTQSWGDFLFFKIFDEQVLEFVLVIQGGGDNGLVIGKMAAHSGRRRQRTCHRQDGRIPDPGTGRRAEGAL